MLCALIMAGGKGTRFWPLSTEEKPKQFLKLLGDRTMIQMTVDRIMPLIPIERVFVVTGKQYVDLVQEQLPELPKENIIIEPYGKNTAPCIALSAFHINRKYPNATMAVLPADHIMKDEKEFLNVLKNANKFVCDKNEAIVTIGMKPDRPETGYGYINFGDMVKIEKNHAIRKVKRFVEKPDVFKAKEYLSDGNYLWNGGMFIWKTMNILKLTQRYLENTFKVLSEIAATSEEEYETILEEKYQNVDAISVDYGIMEKADSIFVIPVDFGWDDVGNWTSLERYREKDENDNIKGKKAFYYKSKGNVVLTNKKVVLNNVEDIIVVETEDYIMISSKEKEQDIKKAKEIVRL